MSEANEVYIFVKRKIEELDRENNSHSRASLAKLRRAIGKSPGESPDIWDITIQGAPETWDSYNGNPSRAEWAVHTALTLYALHRQGKDKTMSDEKVSSFGAAVSHLKSSSPDDDNTAITRRFNAVATATDFNELAHHARGIVQLLKNAGVGMDYPKFAQDLYYFQTNEGANRVRLRWGEAFYRVTISDKQADNQTKTEKGNEEQ